MNHPVATFMALSAALAVSPAMHAAPEQLSEQGEGLYQEHCEACHGRTLQGSAHGSSLSGDAFLDKWADSGAALLAYVEARMPPGEARNLSAEEHASVVAYIDSKNAFSLSGKQKDTASAGEQWANWSAASSIDEAARQAGGYANRTIENYRPVTDAMLKNPPAGDWLSWRRTLDGQGYSPLSEISRDNVNELKLAWVLAMHDGSNQGTPLVHDGIMYLTHPGNIIQAVDASNGDVIWEYRYQFPEGARTLGGPTRNIALYDDKLFLATYDAALVAIDARNGKQLWRTQKANFEQAYTHTSGPIIGDGVVLSGINGCELYTSDGCFITGHDPGTGEELWRTSTIAQPGTPGGDTWGDKPAELRAGSDTWIAGSYDPELKLFFIGTSQAKPWVAASRGMTTEDEALYTNSTLAINPRNGKIVWHYQHIPGETIDMEAGFERVLVEIGGKSVVLTIGKDGILWKLDRSTGEFLALTETLPQNIFSEVDKKTGRVTYREDIRKAGINDPIKACPGIYGGHNWQASAYSPDTGALIIPLHQLCSDLVGREVPLEPGGGGYGGDSRTYAMPQSEGKLGKLVAIDVATMQEQWSHQQTAMFLTGALTTGGGLTFIGDLDRYFSAFDVNTGKQLWQTRLAAPLHGYPITFTAQGKQYLAVQTGIGVFRALTAVVSPQIYQPTNGQAIYVFELP